MTRRAQIASRSAKRAQEDRPDWMIAVEGIVASTQDPEQMHRIKVIIPSMDESRVHDEWVTALVPWVGAPGYGPAHVPEVASEVLLFGRLGQKHTLFYLSRFNEDFPVPAAFADGSRGLNSDTVYKLLGELLILIVSQQQVDVKAPVVRLIGGNGECVRAEPGKVGFLGAQPASRQTLPPDAVDLETCKTLCNALKNLIAIKFGLGQ